MRRTRRRFTLLGLMALIAAMAIAFGVWAGLMRASRRARSYRAKAEEMARAEQAHRNEAARCYNWVISHEVTTELQRERARTEQDQRGVDLSLETLEYMKRKVGEEDLLADYYRDLALKYACAADRPWEVVSPDPTPPGPRPIVLRRR